MEFTFYREPVEFVIIKNFYEKDEVEEIHQELNRLKPHMGGPDMTGTARGVSGNPKKNNSGIFLDELNRDDSVILKLNRKIFTPEIKHELRKGSWFFKYMNFIKEDSTLVSYYKQGDYYKSHNDDSFITAIYYTWKEPKNFEGGDLYFGEFKVPIENNCMLIFPSLTFHEVSKVTKGEGRYALSQFINIHHKPPKIDRYLNFLDVSEFNNINLENSDKWCFTGRSRDYGNKFWYLDLNSDPFYSEYLKDKIEKLVNMKLKLHRVYANGQTYGQDGQFHTDSDSKGTYTFLLFTNIINMEIDEWGGETQFRLNNFLRSYQPVPNSALFFNSNILHRGLGPSRKTGDTMRITVVWKFSQI